MNGDGRGSRGIIKEDRGNVERERNIINSGYLRKREGGRKRKYKTDEAKGGGEEKVIEKVDRR